MEHRRITPQENKDSDVCKIYKNEIACPAADFCRSAMAKGNSEVVHEVCTGGEPPLAMIAKMRKKKLLTENRTDEKA